MNKTDVCLSAQGICKQYPGVLALDHVDFTALHGTINVLVGENGAGKSTLMKIIAGITQPSGGTLYLNGEEINPKNTIDASRMGIGIIHQELNLLPNMMVYQNIFMARESKKFGVLDNKTHIEKTRALLEKMEHPIDPLAYVRNLRVGQQQIVEIAKTMAQQDLKVLIMDEPTSSLSVDEVEVLFKIMRELKSQGVCIIYISHRLDEILRIGDNITVLRDGKLVEQRSCDGVDIPWIVQAMIGKKTNYNQRQYDTNDAPVILEAKNITLPKRNGGYHLEDVSFALRQGKIMGIYGMLGSGRTELLEVLMGAHRYYKGTIHLLGNQIEPTSISSQIERGFVMVPEDRQREGLIHVLSVTQNMMLSSLKKNKRFGFLSNQLLQGNLKKTIAELRIKVSNPKLPILSLSGGNQQKIIIGKGLLTNPKVLLLDEPTRGIDIGAKSDVFTIIEQCKRDGIAIIVVSSELKEIIAISDEILVLREGRAAGFLRGPEISEESLMKCATSAKEATV
ncbi:sugar ABC transporter ATP-binding protein [Spirochaetia bacterium]|nr:sugar ABC transporter ATP-binding protein [Spirochaetia bacterium]